MLFKKREKDRLGKPTFLGGASKAKRKDTPTAEFSELLRVKRKKQRSSF